MTDNKKLKLDSDGMIVVAENVPLIFVGQVSVNENIEEQEEEEETTEEEDKKKDDSGEEEEE